ncbi:MBL fold metallo-hydrolase [Prosthecomicrobium hirschii]|uniref:MBL fold metallo-hydrolase n=1 Tax=Prosthecodimorpha hirschii TaxID=665126 RepID=UPI0022201B67|nr:MBL fold metallo-hydrolase [Prosthecomicrobium hirschii]MCW1839325.1 MBL fold metallo-hydrolase [Prosthecomicrobium hirschii]
MAARLTFRILGCGSSPGVPRIGNDWGQCDPRNPKNRRRRASLLVTRRDGDGEPTRVLVDTGPDLREQMLDTDVDWVDGVLLTHPHADHIHGIDDLRSFVLNRRRRVDVYMDAATSERVRHAFDYCFVTPPGSSYPPILNEHRIQDGVPIAVDGPGGPITAMPYRQSHGDITSLGFRFGGLAYSPDVSAMPEDAFDRLGGLDVLIIDALRWVPHPSHFSVDEALEVIARLKPKRAILTHMHIDLDYRILKAKLPDHVEPAYDGLEIELPA